MSELNVHRNPVTVNLDIRKQMDDGRPVKDQEFSFKFTGNNGTEDINLTLHNDAQGKINVPQIKFEKPGTYQFNIEEIEGNDPTVEYQKGTFPITVTVSGTVDLTAKVSYGGQGSQNLVITNHVILPKYGQLEITKTVSGAGADPDQQFDFTVTLKDDSGTPVSGTFGEYTFTDGSAVIPVSQNKPVVITDIPVGTQYTVTENPLPEDSNYTLSSSNNLTGTIAENNKSEAAFLNTAKPTPLYGDLKISKTVKDAPADSPTDSFSFTVKLDDPDADTSNVSGAVFDHGEASVSVAAGSSVVITGLPAGVGYTVTEQTPDGFAVTSTDSTGHIVANQ